MKNYQIRNSKLSMRKVTASVILMKKKVRNCCGSISMYKFALLHKIINLRFFATILLCENDEKNSIEFLSSPYFLTWNYNRLLPVIPVKVDIAIMARMLASTVKAWEVFLNTLLPKLAISASKTCMAVIWMNMTLVVKEL